MTFAWCFRVMNSSTAKDDKYIYDAIGFVVLYDMISS